MHGDGNIVPRLILRVHQPVLSMVTLVLLFSSTYDRYLVDGSLLLL